MKALRPAILLLAFGVLIASDTAAQWNVSRLETGSNRVYATFGLDPAFIPTVGYGRVVSIWGHPVQLASDVGIVAAELDTRDFRARVQAFTSIVRWRSFHIAGSAAFITRGTDNSIYSGLNFGADLTGTVGFYRKGWFVAGEFGYDKAIITHVTNSDWYRTYFYSDARDGWYLDSGGTVHYGAVGGIGFGRTELLLRYGVLRTENFNELTPPMYASVGFGIAF
jgi:hypothetical protein